MGKLSFNIDKKQVTDYFKNFSKINKGLYLCN